MISAAQICDQWTVASERICPDCQTHPQKTLSIANARSARCESLLSHLNTVCRHCGCYPSLPSPDFCRSLDCPIFFERVKMSEEMKIARGLLHEVSIRF